MFGGAILVQTVAQSCADAAWTELDFDIAEEDTGGFIVVVGGKRRFQVPSDGAGVSIIDAMVSLVPAAYTITEFQINLVRAGATITIAQDGGQSVLAGGPFVALKAGTKMRFMAGDQLYCNVWQTSGAPRDTYTSNSRDSQLGLAYLGP